MRFQLLLTLAAATAVSACNMNMDKKPEEAAKPPAPAPVAAVPPPAPAPAAAPIPPPAAVPAVAKNSVSAVEEALAAKGIHASTTRVPKDKLGGRAECAAVERKMLVMGTDNRFYAVGNYGDAAKATACMTSLQAAYGKAWEKNANLYVVKGAFIFEMGADMPEPDRNTAKDAFVATID
jgi:hypothetical protein